MNEEKESESGILKSEVKEPTKKAKVGHPTKYKESYPTELITLLSTGALNSDVQAKWGISKQTFCTWLNTHQEFKDAYDIGLPKCEAWWSDWGRKGMIGGVNVFNFNAWIAFMNNKFGWAKSDKSEGSTTNISIGSINIQQQSKDQLIEYIESMAIKHKDIIDIELIEDNPSEGKPSDESKS